MLGYSGAPGGIRTPDQQDRNLLLYPAELRAQEETYDKGLMLLIQASYTHLVVTIVYRLQRIKR